MASADPAEQALAQALAALEPITDKIVALLDRLVGVGSLIVFGGVLFALSPYRRGTGSLR